jgi:hypothetical protein
MTHFIRQQFLHVNLQGSEPEGFALQQRLPELYYTKLLPAIEKALDQCAIPGKLLVINKLEIDIGNVDLSKMDQELPAEIAEKLVQQIKYELFNTAKNSQNTEKDIYYAELLDNLWDVFIYFLKNGFLPWNFRLPANKTLEEVIAEFWIEDSSLKTKPLPIGHIANALHSTLLARRLVMQFSKPFVKMLLEEIAPGSSKIPVKLIDDLKSIPLPKEEFSLVRSLILEKSIQQLSSQGVISKEEISKQVLEELRYKTDLFLKISGVFEHTWLEIKLPEIKPLTDRQNAPEESTITETKEGIYIDNAGMILLHPFLPRFFEGLGIAEESRIIRPEKALALLHYLTTGSTKTPEYELVLPKILCNIPLSTPILSEIEITSAETDEATALLDAVIKHWEALRNTSQDGLRGTFLLRPGKLSLKDDGDWLLQVEPRTFDILLDQLPWGITMVKLPWMEKMIWVEWRG